MKKQLLSGGLIIMSFVLASADVSRDTKEQLQELYGDISGFGIDATESTAITQQGGAPTYGEITYEGGQQLLQNLNLTDQDVFYDLGCGIGKLVVQAFFETPAKKVVGMELSPTRCKHAKSVQQKVLQANPSSSRQLEFHEQDIAKCPLTDATVIFMCSTCFSDELMQKIMNNIVKLKDGTRVVTLKRLLPHKDLVLVKELTLPMTWSPRSQVYIYELKRSK
jgi:SAM-dependent methyltransferase